MSARWDSPHSGNSEELKIQLFNFIDKPVEVKKGEILAQGVVVRREAIEWEEVDDMRAAGHGGYKTRPD